MVTESESTLLAGCFTKIERVAELIDGLDTAVRRALQDHKVEQENDVARRRFTFRVVGPPLPMSISIQTGEIIHHLRSVYDNIAWAFATHHSLSGVVPSPRDIQFPVVNDDRGFATAVRRGAIAGMPPSAVALAEGLQPYRAVAPERSVLGLLHALDIEDKHRRPIVTTHAAMMEKTIKISGEQNGNVTIIFPTPPSDGAFTDEEHGEALRYLPYESEREQPNLRIDYETHICPDA